MQAPDLRWLPFMKLVFGFLLLIMLGGLALAIALGKVEMSTSYGLGEIIGAITVLVGGFAHWAFQNPGAQDPDESQEPSK